MASYEEIKVQDYNSAAAGFEPPTNPNPEGAQAAEKPQQQEDTKASKTGLVHVEAPAGQRSTSPLRRRSPLRKGSPDRTRKFFQEKVREVVLLTRYGQWDFDFSPRSAHSIGEDENSPALTVPPWGHGSAKDIFSEILRPAYEPDWKYGRQNSGNRESPRIFPTYADLE